jgi:hypothetical protein
MPRHKLFPGLCLALALASGFALSLGNSRPAWTDDRDLLRFNTASPYLMILLDTSESMNLRMGTDGLPVLADGDDPQSRIYAAKWALYSVFQDIDDTNFAFITFNQTRPRVMGKQFLYYRAPGLPEVGTLPAGVDWPRVNNNPQGIATRTLLDGVPDVVKVANFDDLDVLVFGPQASDVRLPENDPLNPITRLGVAGSCSGASGPGPLRLDNPTDRLALNRFPKLAGTMMWVQAATGQVYRVTTQLVLGQPGDDAIQVLFTFDRATSCPSNPTQPCAGGWCAESIPVTLTLAKDADFGEFLMVDRGSVAHLPGGARKDTDQTADFWRRYDVVEGNGTPWRRPNPMTCEDTDTRPFTGFGSEGNYDSIRPGAVRPAHVDEDFWDEITAEGDTDRWCSATDPNDCIAIKPMLETVFDPRGRPLDRGDFIPFDWATSDGNREEMLDRLAPHRAGLRHFDMASYFDDDPNLEGVHPLKNPAQAPIIAVGQTTLGRALVDLRCWYMGTSGKGPLRAKCRDTPWGTDFAGWRHLACAEDPDFGCRRPFMVLITDGGDDSKDCSENNPTAAVSDMNQFSAVKTWVLNVGEQGACGRAPLRNIAQSGQGECYDVATKEGLLNALQNIHGQIQEATRAFASAAVPTVQATAAQSIYVSNFIPLRQSAIWEGHLNAFLKPMPLVDGRPDTSVRCADRPPDRQFGCFLWDAASSVRDGDSTTDPPAPQQYDATDPVSDAPDRRRVYFGLGSEPEAGVSPRQFWRPTVKGTTPHSVEYDLWRAFGFVEGTHFHACFTSCTEEEEDQNDLTRTVANQIMTNLLTVREVEPSDPDITEPHRVLIGDVFHSDPVVVASPVNIRYFAEDLYHDLNDDACEIDGSGNKGYRCFFQRQKNRRRALFVGHNDGMLRAYNAGQFDSTTGMYDNGTGNELFAFVPRAVMPTIRQISSHSSIQHQWTVDGTPAIFDAFIDPRNDPPDAAQRQWRSVLVGGLREGGRAFFALDVTQPDPLTMPGPDGEFVPASAPPSVPLCATAAFSPSSCGPVPYGWPLWEFTDSTEDSIFSGMAPPRMPMDENASGAPDLGDTWSTANLGRIRLCTGANCSLVDPEADIEDRFVAVFGGGMDPLSKVAPKSGDFLYMLDVETGKVLYKRPLLAPDGTSGGAAPGSPAAVDTNQDGYLDRIYIGTTGGYMYRVDLGPDSAGNIPRMTTRNIEIPAGSNDNFGLVRIWEHSTGEEAWLPQVIFDANFDGDDPVAFPRPIYHRPSVFFVGKLGLYGLAFGTGDREDLWAVTGQEERFYVFVDDSHRADTDLPYTETNFERILQDDPAGVGLDLFVSRGHGHKGWYLVLDENHRVITPGFSLFGVIFFSTYEPLVTVTTDENCDPNTEECPELILACDADAGGDDVGFCSRTGTSRLFVVNATNADPLMPGDDGATRYRVIAQFVTSPFAEPGQTKNPGVGGEGDGDDADQLTEEDLAIMEALKQLYPSECRFTNYRIDIKTIASDTRVERIAAVPICIIEKNWKEF